MFEMAHYCIVDGEKQGFTTPAFYKLGDGKYVCQKHAYEVIEVPELVKIPAKYVMNILSGMDSEHFLALLSERTGNTVVPVQQSQAAEHTGNAFQHILKSAGSKIKEAWKEENARIDAENAEKRRLENLFSPNYKDDFVQVDEQHGLIRIRSGIGGSKLYHSNEIRSYHYVEDNETVTKHHGIRRAIVGGALTGGVGAVVGAVTGKRKTKSFIGSAKLMITTSEPKTYTLTVISKKTKTGSKDYMKAIEKVDNCLAILDSFTGSN